MVPGRMTPVIIGVGDIKNRSQKVKDAIEPMQLMLQAIICALEDATSNRSIAKELKKGIDSISVVATWTWPYADLPGLLSERLGIQPRHKIYSEHGGNQPMKLVDEAAKRIAIGECKVAVVTGGEALASLSACAAAKRMHPPGWTKPESGAEATSPLELSRLGESIGATHSIGLPIHIYALYENAFRAYRKQSIEQNNEESARLYAEFAKIAEQNEFAWNYGQEAPTAETISTVTAKNRMICFPYPLLMNAFNSVNLAASCILTSTEYARRLGIPESKWVYPLGGAGTQDSDSCGLTSFGGAGNNYSMHALTAMVRQLRGGNGQNGLILANGGVLTYQHALCLSTRPRRNGSAYPDRNPLPSHMTDIPIPKPTVQASGEAIIEASPLSPLHHPSHCNTMLTLTCQTYTVEYNRNGTPKIGFIVGRLTSSGNERFVANTGNAKTLEQLSSEKDEPIGRVGWVDGGDGGRNLFTFDFEERANL
ncbi:MAG: hypothetical protein ASARMPREDX12_005031 [Alectoria sarmentosa]|nr:MAG: hypothetical protein ASARMPREDX12_005031 [Alectoria sarmentosa]